MLLSRATMARAWMTLPCAGEAEAIIQQSTEHMDSLLADPVPEWAATSMVTTMAANYRQIHNLRSLPAADVGRRGRSLQSALYYNLKGSTPEATIVDVMARRLLTLSCGEGLVVDLAASAKIANKHVMELKGFLHPAGWQAWVRALFNAWLTSGRCGGQPIACAFCQSAASDTLSHYARCHVLAFYGSELIPQLWTDGYQMVGVESFLGADALFSSQNKDAVLLAAWLDAVHSAVMAHSRCQFGGHALQHLAARLRVFPLKFAKNRLATKWLCDHLCPAAASMAQWT